MTLPGPALVCPHCHQLDQVQKVSSIVAAGPMTTTRRGPPLGVGVPLGPTGGLVPLTVGAPSLQGTSQSVLSQRLTLPPPNPRAYLHRTLYTTMMLGVLLSMGTLLGNRMNLLPASDLSLLIGVLAAWALALVLVGVGQQLPPAQDRPAWRTAHAAWQELYYCWRCDGVFLPEVSSSLLPAEQLCATLLSAVWQQAHLLRS
jgi:hypothetical protein